MATRGDKTRKREDVGHEQLHPHVEALRSRYAWARALGNDAELIDYYAELMLEPGWNGKPNNRIQVTYVRDVILGHTPSPYRLSTIRHKWGFWQGSYQRVSHEAVELIMERGDPDSPEHNARLLESLGALAPEHAFFCDEGPFSSYAPEKETAEGQDTGGRKSARQTAYSGKQGVLIHA